MAKRKIPTDDVRLDRRIPTDFSHVEKYPGSKLRMLQRTVEHVEKKLTLPKRYHAIYDQGQEGACVGFGMSILMSLLNRKLYDALWLYREAQIIDEWADTPPEGGTSLRAGFDILRDKGHRRLWGGQSRPPEMDEGIVEVNRWLTTVDEGRTAISEGKPIADGVWWFNGFYTPIERRVKVRGVERVEFWLPPRHRWGRRVGGHCITRTVASDQRQAFGWSNSWGTSYPWPVYVDYTDMEYLQSMDGEQGIVTDK